VPEPRPRWQRPLTIAAGWLFIVLGIAGLVLPFLQGILFLLVGLMLLSREQHWAGRLMRRLRARFPRLTAKVDEAEAYVARLGRRLRDRLRRR
jgi:uncharacterized protein